jgi:hypothetical protein
MSTDVMSTALRPRLSPRPARTWLRLEHVVMGAAIVSLIVLVVLPLAFLLVGSFKSSGGVSLDAYSEVLTGRWNPPPVVRVQALPGLVVQ